MRFARLSVRRSDVPVAFLVFLMAALVPASAQDANECDVTGEAPDVIVGDLHELQRFGTIGGITGYSVGTVSCNVGTCQLDWISGSNEHPVIGQNMYRLKDGRFEQIGMSWLKHGFFALSEELCNSGCVGTDGTHLGVNCSDPYSAGLNGSQGRLGPRSEVNAFTGEYPYPFTTINQGGDAIYKRLQVHDSDLDPALNSGASYFVEGQYVTHDDAGNGNGTNNASWRQVDVIPQAGQFLIQFTLLENTVREQAAIYAWQAHTAATVRAVTVPGEGQFLFGANVTDLGGGVWRYEYAVQNLNSDRSGSSFAIPVPKGAAVTNLTFHDVDYHSGEPYDGTDWAVVHDTTNNRIVWSTDSFAANPDANALRWGTLYSFSVDVDVAPTAGEMVLGLFKPGTPLEILAINNVPDVCNVDGICDPGEDCGNCAVDCVGQGACCGDATCDSGEDACTCAVDCGPAPSAELVCDNAVDDDCDGLTDCGDLDCCVDSLCADGIDADLDGVAECDCDDANPTVWTTPGEAEELRLDEQTGQTILSWLAPVETGGTAPSYDLLRSTDPSDFDGAANCLLGSGHTTTSAVDTAVPTPGTVFHYLVRAVNDCPVPMGEGTLGYSSTSERAGQVCP